MDLIGLGKSSTGRLNKEMSAMNVVSNNNNNSGKNYNNNNNRLVELETEMASMTVVSKENSLRSILR